MATKVNRTSDHMSPRHLEADRKWAQKLARKERTERVKRERRLGVFIGGTASEAEAEAHRADGGTYSDDEATEACDVEIYLPSDKRERLFLIEQILKALVGEDDGSLTLRRQLVTIYNPSKWRKVRG